MGILKLAGAAMGIGPFPDIGPTPLFTAVSGERLEEIRRDGLKSSLSNLTVLFETVDALRSQMDSLGVEDALHVLEIDVAACQPKTFVSGAVLGEKASDGSSVYLALRRIGREAISEMGTLDSCLSGPSPA